MRRGHDNIGIARLDPLHKAARAGVARHHGPPGQSPFPHVQPQVGLPLLGILTMAVETVFRQDRSDIAVEIDRAGVTGGSRPPALRSQQQNRSQAPEKPPAGGLGDGSARMDRDEEHRPDDW